MLTEFGGGRSCDQNFIGRKSAKKLMSLKRYISVNTDIGEKWFVIFERTINYLSFGCVRLPQPECYFFFVFSYFFSFSSQAMHF